MNNLYENLGKMEELYQESIKKVADKAEFKHISSKLELIQGLKAILWASENMERFIESMKEPS